MRMGQAGIDASQSAGWRQWTTVIQRKTRNVCVGVCVWARARARVCH